MMDSAQLNTNAIIHPVEAFLSTLYGPNPPGYLALWDKKTKRTTWIPAKDFQAAAKWVESLPDGHDGYFGLGLHIEPKGTFKRGDASSVIGTPGLWMDIDIKSEAHAAQDLPASLDDVEDLLAEFPLSPTMLIDSGHGFHPYWLFPELELLSDDQTRKRARERSNSFQDTLIYMAKEHGWHVDKTSDLARVLRLPGTTNWKLDGERAPVNLLTVSTGNRYHPDAFQEHFFQAPKEEVDTGKQVLQGKGDYSTLDIVRLFEAHDLYGKEIAIGKHAVACPWASEHTEDTPTWASDSVAWEALEGKWPTFHCSHGHCNARGINDVITILGDADKFCGKEFQSLANSHRLPDSKDQFLPTDSGKGMNFLTAAEVAAMTPENVEFIAKPWVARGSLTEIDGKIKAAGKTTFLMAMCRKVLDGLDFMGEPTIKSPVVYLTEQPMSSLRETLRRADLLERDDLYLQLYQDTIGTPWPDVVEHAIRKCQEIKALLLVIDTLPQFAGIRGESENTSGAALEALEPVQVAALHGIATAYSRHDRKAGGEVGESGRGSSAWGGVSDVIVSIRRGEGNTSPTIRHLHSLSRFDETPGILVIDLQDGGYVSLGTETKVAEQDAAKKLWGVMPESEGDALPRNDLLEKANCGSTYGKKIIKAWYEAGHLAKVGRGVTNDPERFWKLELSRTEPPSVVTNQVGAYSNTLADETSDSGLVTTRDEVVTNQVPAGMTVGSDDGGTGSLELDTAQESELVTTPNPMRDQPSLDEDFEEF